MRHNRRPCLRLMLTVTALLAVVVGQSLAAQTAQLKAGAAAVDITPQKWPVPLIGSFSFRPAEAAHDPLHVRCIVLSVGQTKIAIGVVDSCYVKREVLDLAKEKASKQSGIPTGKMLISATHTHTAPPCDARHGSAPELAYRQLLIDKIAEAVVRADQQLEPAEIGWGSGDLPDEVFNRRWYMKEGTIPPDPFGNTTDVVKMNPPRGRGWLVKPAGPTDPEVSIVSIRTAKGRPLALLANYSLHYVGNVPRGLVSADYFGEFARLLENRLRGSRPVSGFVGILSNGTSGDINNINFLNPRPPREPFEQIRIVAGKVADVAYRAYREIEHKSDVDLAMAERELTLNLRVPSPQQIANAKATLKIEDESTLPRLAKAYARRTLDLAKRGETTKIKLQAVRIGGLGIVAIPFETFAEIGLEIKQNSPLQPTFVIELANGGEGYLPTPKQHKLGGYETWLTTNRVEINASRKITDALLEMLNEVEGSRE